MSFDLLTTVEYGGCSAKLPAEELTQALSGLPASDDPNLLVGISTHDDAGVYRIRDDLALVQTTDFFPPVCSDPYTFGRIAAANALSDVFAMGGEVKTALNLVMFPSKRIPLDVLRDILRGGQEAVHECGGVIVGGHTIDDYPPKYGLAVTGVVHPDEIIRNDRARPGDTLILTKPLGVGVLAAAHRLGRTRPEHYQQSLACMMQLNLAAARIMRRFGVRCATDITGFGLLGHALEMALGSGVVAAIDAARVPRLGGAYELVDIGCIPGAAFRNQSYVEPHCRYRQPLDPNLSMLLLDAQTSGGMLICAPPNSAGDMVAALHASGYERTSVIGEIERADTPGLRVYAD